MPRELNPHGGIRGNHIDSESVTRVMKVLKVWLLRKVIVGGHVRVAWVAGWPLARWLCYF